MFSRVRAFARSKYLRLFRPSALAPVGPFNFYLLDDKPLIILTFTPAGLNHVRTMVQQVAPRPCHVLVGFWWTMEDVGRVKQFQRNWDAIQAAYPSTTLHVLCNATAELELFRAYTNIPAALVSHNCFLDEELCTVMPGVEKQFDAVYNARMAPYKRLELAHSVDNLVVITSPLGGRIEGDYFNTIREHLQHAHWPNFDEVWTYRRLPAVTVQRYLNASRTGLVLSSNEGACYASGEYLLSGIPVVSTASSGGRDELFTRETATIVEDDPVAIARAVKDWATREVDPHQVRQATLEIIWQHRRRFIAIIDDIRKTNGVLTTSFLEEWPDKFSNKMKLQCKQDEFADLVHLEGFMKRMRGQREKYDLGHTAN